MATNLRHREEPDPLTSKAAMAIISWLETNVPLLVDKKARGTKPAILDELRATVNAKYGVRASEITEDGDLKIHMQDGTVQVVGPVRGSAGRDGRDGKDGRDAVGIAEVNIDDEYNLGIRFTDDTVVDLCNLRPGTPDRVEAFRLDAKGHLLFNVVGADGATAVYDVGRIVGQDGKDGVDGKDGKRGIAGQPGPAGRSIQQAVINNAGELVIDYDDGKQANLGYVGNGNVLDARITEAGKLKLSILGGREIDAGLVRAADGRDGPGFIWRGEWRDGTTYYGQADNPDGPWADCVSSKGSSYIAVARVTAEPPSSGWGILAARGEGGQSVVWRSSGGGSGGSGGGDGGDVDLTPYVKRDGTTSFTAPQTGVAATGNNHLTTKSQMDSAVGGATAAAAAAQTTANNAMPKSGGTFTGNITVPNGTSSGHAVNRGQLDSAVTALDDDITAVGTVASNAMPKSGGTFTGAIQVPAGASGNQVPNFTQVQGMISGGGADLSPYVKRDGSTSFTAVQAGVDGTGPTHLVTKSQMDAADGTLASAVTDAQNSANAAQSTANAAMPKTGGTFTGQISLPAPAGVNNAARKTDVDTVAAAAAAAQTTADAALPKSGGTMTGVIAAGTHIPTVTADATTANQLVRKSMLDSVSTVASGAASAASAAQTTANDALSKSGGTMTGVIVCGTNLPTATADATNSTQLVRKNQLDGVSTAATNAQNTANAAMPKSGGTFTGAVDFGPNVPTATADAGSGNQLVRKSQMDTALAGVGGGGVSKLPWQIFGSMPAAASNGARFFHAGASTPGEQVPSYAFSGSADNTVDFYGLSAAEYANGNITVTLWVMGLAGTSDASSWGVGLKRQAGGDILASLSYSMSTQNTGTISANTPVKLTFTINAANRNGLLANEPFILRITRTGSSDTYNGDLYLLSNSIRIVEA